MRSPLPGTGNTAGYDVGDATVANGIVFAASGDGHLYAFNAATGEELWSYANSFEGGPTVVNGNVYEGGDSGVVYAFGLR